MRILETEDCGRNREAEAWLRTLALDFEGVRGLCEFIMRPGAEYPTSQPKVIASVAAGYAELDRGRFDEAVEYFKQARPSANAQILPALVLANERAIGLEQRLAGIR